MRLLAIDIASYKTGIAVFDNGRLVSAETLELSIENPLKRRITMVKLIRDRYFWLKAGNFDQVVSEAPYLRGPANNGMQRLLGMLEWLREDIQWIHPMTVKKALGSGSLDKLEVALAAGKLLKTVDEKELLARAIAREAWDETDAVAIGLAYARTN